MKLVNFSVTNYRSITKTHKIDLQNLTVLVGKNNEGKSNFLTALNAAMSVLMQHGRGTGHLSRVSTREIYNWERDFPIQFQNRKNSVESIFKLEFCLEETELVEFKKKTGIRGNENIPVTIKIGKNLQPTIEVPKKGSSAYNNKSPQIANFISKRISFNYIQAVRTEDMALNVLRDVIIQQLSALSDNQEYNECVEKINKLQQEVLDQISKQLVKPLSVFLPQIDNVHITKQSNGFFHRPMRNDIEVFIDDGTRTSISYKGDGVKSLATLAILKDRKSLPGASIIAIEEPESHLHSGAIHSLIEVIRGISENNQVIITTHNPLFVQQNNINSNIIVDSGTAKPAKNISEIRNVLGVLPSDNLKNASHVFVVEGEGDKIALTKILSYMSTKIDTALNTNKLIIKPLAGAGNLSHDLADLKNSMCKYFVLMDNDEAGRSAIDKALVNNLLSEADYKLTICNGSPNAEFEDCLNPNIYKQILIEKFATDINVPAFNGNKKWSERIKNVRLSQGGPWTSSIEKEIKKTVADAIPDNIDDIENIVIVQKAGFLHGCVDAIERILNIH